jgi:hypothetical protein
MREGPTSRNNISLDEWDIPLTKHTVTLHLRLHLLDTLFASEKNNLIEFSLLI